MAGLDPAIQLDAERAVKMDPRVKPGDDKFSYA